MIKLLEDAIARIRSLPDADQEIAAEMLLTIASRSGPPVPLDDATRAAVREGREQARRGEFASDDEMEAVFRSHRL